MLARLIGGLNRQFPILLLPTNLNIIRELTTQGGSYWALTSTLHWLVILLILSFVIHLQTLFNVVIILKEHSNHCINIYLFNVSVKQY